MESPSLIQLGVIELMLLFGEEFGVDVSLGEDREGGLKIKDTLCHYSVVYSLF